ncbi:MAG TPA: iron-containing alcohol dehydrogenase [Candidatus Marinimicrobia bacterium]|nr:iron-containing alcohol dehydrogenase [Candidatus Neomarinimicrobiota bacterium]
MTPFYMPVQVFFGYGCLKKTTFNFKSAGRKALIVTGRHSAELSGALQDMKDIFEDQGVEFCHFDQVTENPLVKTVQCAVDLFKSESCDFIVGIGGGSPIDAAKAVSVVAYNCLNARDVYEISRIKGAYPIVAIPLTSGTGTEVTPFSVLSDDEKGKKAGFGHVSLFPVVSFCDPVYTLTVPPVVTRDTGLDALSHLIEGIFSDKRDPVTYPLIDKGLRAIVKNLPLAIEDGSNLELRSELMMASLWGGMVIAKSGTTLQHAIGYPLTVRYGVSHGRSNGLFLSQILDLFYPALEIHFEKALGSDYQEVLREVKKLIVSFDLTGNLKLDETRLPDMTREVLGARNMANNPLSVNASDIMDLYKKLI